MKLSRTCTLSALLLFGATCQLRAENFYILETTDLRGRTALQICTEPEKVKIESDLSAEATAYPKALEETKKDWQLNHAGLAFPNNRIKPRTMHSLATTITRDEANKLLAQNKGREARELAKAKTESKRVLNMKPSRGNNNTAYIQQQKREVREDREKDAAADKAEVALRQKLAAAVGHEIPLYGETPADQQNNAPKKKSK